jgi:hypothetical protein
MDAGGVPRLDANPGGRVCGSLTVLEIGRQ